MRYYTNPPQTLFGKGLLWGILLNCRFQFNRAQDSAFLTSIQVRPTLLVGPTLCVASMWRIYLGQTTEKKGRLMLRPESMTEGRPCQAVQNILRNLV